MGLKSGPDGVKAQFRERFPSAFSKVNTLSDLADGMSSPQGGNIAIIDGNVAVMGAPQSVQSYSEYVGFLRHSLRQHAAAAGLLIVVFDEPKVLTTAKLEEQIKRDELGQKRAMPCSANLQAPCNDEYDIDELSRVVDCRELIRNRPARLRFFDSIIMAILNEEGDRRNSPLEISEMIADGIDCRGAHRCADAEREAGIVGSDPELVEWYRRDAEHSIGEGDLKLTWATIRSDELIADAKLAARNCFLVTIDTDSLLIELIESAKRKCEAVTGPTPPTKRILCMRERGRRDVAPYYTVCDLSSLHNQVAKYLWSRAPEFPTPKTSLHAMLLISGALALCGSDFCQLKGLTAERVLRVLPRALANAKQQSVLLQPIGTMEKSRTDAQRVAISLSEVVALVEAAVSDQSGLRQVTRDALQNPDPNQLLRGAWVVAYWKGTTWGGSLVDFGFSL